jgi:hypothetical protein
VSGLSVDALMAELQGRAGDELRREVLRHGASPALEDPALFAEVERVLRQAIERRDARALLLPELAGDPARTRLETGLRLSSHRGAVAGRLIVGIKRRVLLPLMRWLFDYSRDNVARQQEINRILFACIQELAIQNAILRRELERRP